MKIGKMLFVLLFCLLCNTIVFAAEMDREQFFDLQNSKNTTRIEIIEKETGNIVNVTKEEEIKIPEAWERIIYKPDGSRKKVILYNTSVSAMLKHEEKMLRKIESVLQTFRESLDEVALLWRPHPLMEATIQSMRPGLREGYERLVAQYRAEGWGIYDDSADLDRAVLLGLTMAVEDLRERGVAVHSNSVFARDELKGKLT